MDGKRDIPEVVNAARPVSSGMEVRVVMVMVVMVVTVRAKEAAEVKREVEEIFKQVEDIMAGRSSQVKRTFRTSTLPSLAASEDRSKVETAETTSEVETPINRAFVKPTASFPIGVIVSDNLYPLVVGKNADTGQPFVMNLDKQHAMVVARGAVDGGYRLVIPFPVMMGSQRFGDYEEEDPPAFPVYRSPRPVMPVTGYGSYPGYIASPEGRTNYQEEPSSVETPAKVHNKYAHGFKYQEDLPYQEEPRHVKYHQKLPKKYLRPVPTLGHARHKPVDSLDSFPTDPHSRFRPTYLTNPKEQLSYYVEGPKYIPIAKKIVPIAYRQAVTPNPALYSPKPAYSFLGPPRRVIQYRNYYNDVSQNSHPVNRYPSAYSSVPKDFRPSPYLGSITESRDNRDEEAEATTLQPQSEIFETYDDRGDEMNTEKDFDDASSDK